MPVNNSTTIKSLLKFPTPNSFYFLEVIKRRKENPDLPKHAKLIKDFFIYSPEEFDKCTEKAIELCEEHNARAYFRLNLRDSKKVAFQYLKRISELLITEDYKAIPRSYAAVAGEFHSDPDKTWVIDLDGEQANAQGQAMVLNQITVLNPDAVVALLPTLNGLHIISRPFRLDTFRKVLPDVDVHKDNPTVLYAK
jgi:hypothetical protein